MGTNTPFTIANPLDDNSVIDRWHHECHAGKIYEFHYDNLSLASSGTIYLHIKTGAKDAHIDVQFAVLGGHLQVQWYGAPTVGTAGTVVSCINRNRNYKNVASLTTMDIGPTVTTVGTVLFGARTLLGAASSQSKAGSNITGDAERILTSNTDHLVKCTSVGIIAFTIDGLFYEETPE